MAFIPPVTLLLKWCGEGVDHRLASRERSDAGDPRGDFTIQHPPTTLPLLLGGKANTDMTTYLLLASTAVPHELMRPGGMLDFYRPTGTDSVLQNQHPAHRGGGKDAAKFDEVLVKARALLV